MSETRTGYMCGVDFQHHLENDARPVKVYADEWTLRRMRPCVAECGIVEVEIKVVRWVQPQKI